MRKLALFGLFCSFLLTSACAKPSRHVLVVIDQSLFEVLNDVSRFEQQALCQQDSCYQRDAAGNVSGLIHPIPGWSEEKSISFNRKLKIAVGGGREFNRVLAQWQPGMAMPPQLHDLIIALSQALDFYVSSVADEQNLNSKETGPSSRFPISGNGK